MINTKVHLFTKAVDFYLSGAFTRSILKTLLILYTVYHMHENKRSFYGYFINFLIELSQLSIYLTKNSERKSVKNLVSMEDSVSMNRKSENSDQKSQSMSFRWIFQCSAKCWIWFSMADCSCFCVCIFSKLLSYTSIIIFSNLQESLTKLVTWMMFANA